MQSSSPSAPEQQPTRDLRCYGWLAVNQTPGFATWEAEIAHVESMGFKLAPPDFHVPHWSEESATKVFVNGPDGLRELSGRHDRCAAEFGYPLFLQVTR